MVFKVPECYGLDLQCLPKAHVLKLILQDRALGKRLDHEGTKLHEWINPLVDESFGIIGKW